MDKDECLRRLKLEMEFMTKQLKEFEHTILGGVVLNEINRLEHWIKMIQSCE